MLAREVSWMLLVVALFIGGMMVYMGFDCLDSYRHKYSGKIVFDTEQEYADFKVAVGSSKVDIKEMEVLNSDTPIVAEFLVHTSQPFGYGKHDSGDKIGAIISLVGGGVIVLFGLYQGIFKREEY